MKWYRCLIWLLAISSLAAYFVLLYLRFVTFENGDDFGVFMQSVNDSTGWLRNSIEGSHYANHFSPIYEIAVPFTRWTSSCVPLMVLQALAGAVVAPGLFELGNRVLPARLALGIASVAFIYPPLIGLIYDDPYENVFAPAVTIWLILATYRRQWFIATLLGAIALAIKEDQAVFLICASLIALFAAHGRRDRALQAFSVCVLLASVITLASYLLFIRPSIAGPSNGWAALEDTLRVTASSHAHGPFVFGRLSYLALIALPLAFLPLAAPRWFLLFLVAPLVEILLARRSIVWTMGTHYAGVWIGYVLVAAVLGLARIYRHAPITAVRLLIAASVLSSLTLVVSDPAHLESRVHLPTQHDRALDRILSTRLPPPGTRIGTSDVLFGHLWSRPEAEIGVAQSPYYIIIDMHMMASRSAQQMLAQIKDRTIGNYRPLWNDSGVVLFVRRVGNANSTGAAWRVMKTSR